MPKPSFLDKEKTIRNQIIKIKRIIISQQKLVTKKRREYSKIAKKVKIGRGPTISKIQYVYRFYRKGNMYNYWYKKEKQKLIAEVLSVLGVFERIVRQQYKLTGTQMRFDSNQSEQLKHLKKIPLFTSLNPAEKIVLEEFVENEGQLLGEIYKQMKRYTSYLSMERRHIVDSKDYLQGNTFGKELDLNLESFFNDEEEILNWMLPHLDICVERCKVIIEDGKVRRSKEDVEIKKTFNHADLQQALIIGGSQLRYEKDRVTAIRQLLFEQRRIRNPLVAKQMIAVHATKYFPVNGIITTGGMHEVNFSKEKKIKIRMARETIHFSLNNIVTEHCDGAAWSAMPYAILIPVEKITNRIAIILGADTFVVGALPLPTGSDIVVNKPYSKTEYQKLQSKAGKAQVVFSNPGENLPAAVVRRLGVRGYTVMMAAFHGWTTPTGIDDDERAKIIKEFGFNFFNELSWAMPFQSFAKKLGVPYAHHTHSVWGKMEDIVRRGYAVLYGPEQFTVRDSDGDNSSLQLEVQNLKEKIPKIMVEVAQEFNKLKNYPERYESHNRIRQILKKIYSDLKRKYPQYWK